jgi:hypothetical protein
MIEYLKYINVNYPSYLSVYYANIVVTEIETTI